MIRSDFPEVPWVDKNMRFENLAERKWKFINIEFINIKFIPLNDVLIAYKFNKLIKTRRKSNSLRFNSIQ